MTNMDDDNVEDSLLKVEGQREQSGGFVRGKVCIAISGIMLFAMALGGSFAAGEMRVENLSEAYVNDTGEKFNDATCGSICNPGVCCRGCKLNRPICMSSADHCCSNAAGLPFICTKALRCGGGKQRSLCVTQSWKPKSEDGFDWGRITSDWAPHLGKVTALKSGDPIPQNNTVALYHQTNPKACKAIVATNFKMEYCSAGWCGKGIYFAMSPEATKLKAVSDTSGHGCMIEAIVDVGRLQRFDSCGMCSTMNLDTLHTYGADAILFEPPELTGDEVIIFEPSRILSKRIVPFKHEWLSHLFVNPTQR